MGHIKSCFGACMFLDLKLACYPDLVGNKAARLATVFHAVPIPPGFVLPFPLFDRHICSLNFSGIANISEHTDFDYLKEISDKIQNDIQSKPLDKDIIENLTRWLPATPLAIRSSASLEDGLQFSFAGKYDSFLHITDNLEFYIKKVWSSLYNLRALIYQYKLKIPFNKLKMSVIFQEMVDSKLSGVLLTVNPQTGKRELIIEGSRVGVVGGNSNGELVPEFVCNALSKYVVVLSRGFGDNLDIEWVVDRQDRVFITQIRPFYFKPIAEAQSNCLNSRLPRLLGTPVGLGEISGVAYKTDNPLDSKFRAGDILVVKDTSPDWEPLMWKAGGLITDHGCRTSHAALTAREMGLKAIIGTSDATSEIATGLPVKLCLAENIGYVF